MSASIEGEIGEVDKPGHKNCLGASDDEKEDIFHGAVEYEGMLVLKAGKRMWSDIHDVFKQGCI